MDSIPLARGCRVRRRRPRGLARVMLESAHAPGGRWRRLRHLSRQLGPPGVGRTCRPRRRSPGCTSPESSAPRRSGLAIAGSACSGRASRWPGASTATPSPRWASRRWSPIADDFDTVDRIIFSELVHGIVTDASRSLVRASSTASASGVATLWPWPARRSRCWCGRRTRRCRCSTRLVCWPLPRSARPSRDVTDWILHVDLDQFLAAVEILRRPELAGRPVVVGGDGTRTGRVRSWPRRRTRPGRSGCARACRCGLAARKCPDAVFLPVRPPGLRRGVGAGDGDVAVVPGDRRGVGLGRSVRRRPHRGPGVVRPRVAGACAAPRPG